MIACDNIFFNKSELKYLGRNTIIGKTVRIRKPYDVTIGDNSIIDDFTYISVGMDIGNNSHIASNVSISGGQYGARFIMGNYSTISNGCSIHCASSDFKECSLELPSIPKDEHIGGVFSDIQLGNYVIVGAHSCILPGVVVPDGVAFGAYTLVKPNIKLLPYHLYVGIDCRDLGLRDNTELIENHIKSKNGKV